MPQYGRGSQVDPQKSKDRMAAILSGIMDFFAPQIPNITDENREQNAQDLLAGGSGDSPDKMAKVLGVAGRGLSENLYGNIQQQTPQSTEDLALRLSPLFGGLIPPKYVRPLVNQLKNRALNDPKVPYKDILEEYIDRYPNVAANIGHITEMKDVPFELPPHALTHASGVYRGHSLGEAARIRDNKWNILDTAASGEKPFGTVLGINSELIEAGRNSTWKDSPVFFDNSPEFMRNVSPQGTIRHEMTHAAQDAMRPIVERKMDNRGFYPARPLEIGARYSQTPKAWPFEARMQKVLDDIPPVNPSYLDDMDYAREQLIPINNRLEHRNWQVDLDTQTGELRLRKLNSRIVLDKP